jgi:hypothetical protein
MTNYIVERYGENWGTTSVEVQIGNTAGTYFLPDNSIVRNKRIIGLFVMSNEDDTANSPTGRPLVADEAVRSSYITLKKDNDEIIHEHALSDFLQNPANDRLRLLNLCNMNPQKCKIQVSNTSLVSAGESIVLQFVYER